MADHEPSNIELYGHIKGLRSGFDRHEAKIDELDRIIRGNGSAGLRTLVAEQNITITHLARKISNLTHMSWSVILAVLVQLIVLLFKLIGGTL